MLKFSGIISFLLFLVLINVSATQIIEFSPEAEDMTPIIRKAIEGISDSDVTMVFTKGVYRFKPDYAMEKYCYITNHNNGLKKMIFPFEGINSIEIEGNGSEFIFHGQVMPFLFKECQKVTVKDLSIDWDIPFTFQGEVVAHNAQEEWYDLKPFTEGFSWTLKNGEVSFPNIDGFSFSSLGSTLAFDPEKKRVAHGALDFYSKPSWVEEREYGVLRMHGKIRQYPKIGSIFNFKGPMTENRYAPAIQVISSKNIHFDKVIVHHALGMGFLVERSETVTISNSGVYLKEKSPRVVSIIADATHFCNCRGDIVVENCRFENMLDDGTNVHGTYVEVDEIINSHIVRFEVKHFQQQGFEFAGAGDVIWFIHAPGMGRATENEVVSVAYLNERYSELRFKNKLPENLAKGDLLENKTWNPTFTMSGCTIQNHRARGIVLKTPLKVVIEKNYFSSMMSAVFLRGESYHWFESGAVGDVLIQNNTFSHCAYGGMEHAILYVTPRFGKSFSKDDLFDKNIRFVDNTIETFDSRIIWTDRVDGLLIKNNKITKTNKVEAQHPDAPLFDLKNCKNVEIIDNLYQGEYKKAIEADDVTQKSLKVSGNSGF